MKENFNCIAGYEREKEEALKICNVINKYEEYKDLGITLPKGLLLCGSPGVGKTLFAKAIANETKRTFIDVDLAGVNAEDVSRHIVDKFNEAKEKAPSIIFIDEIHHHITEEKVFGYESDFTRTNLSTLLSLLDGFKTNDEVMLIATTNRLRLMPPALIRPGRVDKHITLANPDEKSRQKIIDFYMDKIKLEKAYDKKQFLLITDGLTAADIKTIVNETAIDAISENTNVITLEKLLMYTNIVEGKYLYEFDKQKRHLEEYKITAYHELGHFVVANELNRVVKDVSIMTDTSSYGRIRFKKYEVALTKEDLFNNAVIALAGGAAEEIFLNHRYTGSHNDIQQAFDLLKYSVNNGDYGLRYVHINNGPSMSSDNTPQRNLNKVKRLMNKASKVAYKLVKKHQNKVKTIHPLLVEKGIVTGYELSNYFEGELQRASQE